MIQIKTGVNYQSFTPVFSVREKIRTPDTLVRSQVLYPAELHTHNKHNTNLLRYDMIY